MTLETFLIIYVNGLGLCVFIGIVTWSFPIIVLSPVWPIVYLRLAINAWRKL